MLFAQDILSSSKQAIAEQTIKQQQALEEIQIKKEQQVLQEKLDALDSKISKAVSQTSISTPAPTPAKSMTLIHVGLLAGGLVGGYFIFKFMNK